MASGKVGVAGAWARSDRPGFRSRAWAFYFAHRPAIVLGMAVYLLLIHFAAFYQLWHSSWPGTVAWKLGLGTSWVEYDSAYRMRRAQLRRLSDSIDPGAAIFIGDSIMASLDAGALVDRAVQLSISGDTTRRVLSRIDYYPLATARVVVFHVGTNDLLYRRPTDLPRPFARLLHVVPANVPVVLSAILPIDERATNRYSNADVRAANRIMAQACAERPKCTFVDGGPAVIDAHGNLDPRYHEGDGVHLNGAGNRVWRTVLAPALAPWRDR